MNRTKVRSKICGELPSAANCRPKIRGDETIDVVKMRRKATKFICITFAQYCMCMGLQKG